MFGSVPVAKVRVVVDWPVSSLVDDMYSRLSIPFICCSMTWTTVFCTVVAEAPGYVVLIWTEGGATGGNCSMGSDPRANPPASMIRIERTIAKMGRSMKNLAMAWLPLFCLRQRRSLRRWGNAAGRRLCHGLRG